MADEEVGDYTQQYVENQKVVLDYLKHIMTLDTGSILLLATLLEKFFSKPLWKPLVAATFLLFMISVLALTLSAFGVVRSIRTPSDVSNTIKHFTASTFIVGIVTFVGGLGTLSLWAVRNWL